MYKYLQQIVTHITPIYNIILQITTKTHRSQTRYYNAQLDNIALSLLALFSKYLKEVRFNCKFHEKTGNSI